MTEQQFLHSFPKNETEEVRFSIRRYKDRAYLDLRVWFQPSEGGEYRPTKKGLTLGVEFLPELRRALESVPEEVVAQVAGAK